MTTNNKDLFQDAFMHHKAGDLMVASNIYHKILERQPGHVDAMLNLGTLNLQYRCLDSTTMLVNKVIELNPDYPVAHNVLGIVLQIQGKIDDAIASYNQAIALMPNYAEAHYNLGGAFKKQGKLEDAIRSYRRVIALIPDDFDSHRKLGKVLKEKGKFEEAIEYYRKTITLKPNNADLHNNPQVTLKEQGKFEEALASYNLNDFKPQKVLDESFYRFFFKNNKVQDDDRYPNFTIKYDEIKTLEDWKRLQLDSFYQHSISPESTLSYIKEIEVSHTRGIITQIYNKFMPKEKANILDLGCGQAYLSQYFANKGHNVICFDLPEVLRHCRKDIDNITYVEGNFNDNFPNGQYNVILSDQVIEHVVEDFKMLKDIYEHLAPGGLLFISTLGTLQDRTNFYEDCHIRAYPSYSLETLLKTAGFSIQFFSNIPMDFVDAQSFELIVAVGKK